MKKILKFYSKTCGPCKVVGNNLSKVTGVEIQEIDIADSANESLMSEYNVRTIPTVIIVENGKVLKEFKGIVSTETILDALKDA